MIIRLAIQSWAFPLLEMFCSADENKLLSNQSVNRGHVMRGLTMSPLSDWSDSVTVNQAKTTYSHQYWTATIQQACLRLLGAASMLVERRT